MIIATDCATVILFFKMCKYHKPTALEAPQMFLQMSDQYKKFLQSTLSSLPYWFGLLFHHFSLPLLSAAPDDHLW